MTATTARLLLSIFAILLLIPFTINIVKASSASAEINAADADMNMRPSFPAHWGNPPGIQTRDLVQLPGEYGRGSGTLRKWISDKMAEDDAGSAGASIKKSIADDGKLWPDKDLVGMTGDEAKAAVLAGGTILAENIHITPHDAMVTMDYREDRVRMFVDDGKVVRQPRIG